MKEFYRVGEVSQLFDISISTLRYYDQIELFQPMKIDAHSRYRQYHISQFSILSQIRMYRGLGIPIQEIKRNLFNAKPPQVLEFVDQAEKQLNRQMVEIQRKLVLVESIKKDVEKAVEQKNHFVLLDSPEFVVLAHDHESDTETQIEDLQELAAKAREADPKRYTTASFIELLSKDDFLARRRVLVVKGIGLEEREAERSDYPILKSRYCLHCFVEVENHQDLSDYIAVYEYLDQHSLEVTGNILQIHVMHYHRNLQKILVAELYIPVRKTKKT